MSSDVSFKLRFEFEFSKADQSEERDRLRLLEARDCGVLSHVLVEFSDGRLYPVYFYDPVRLEQDLMTMKEVGQPFIADVGMIVVPEITLEVMQLAVERLVAEGFFDNFVPVTEVDLATSSPHRWPPSRFKQAP